MESFFVITSNMVSYFYDSIDQMFTKFCNKTHARIFGGGIFCIEKKIILKLNKNRKRNFEDKFEIFYEKYKNFL